MVSQQCLVPIILPSQGNSLSLCLPPSLFLHAKKGGWVEGGDRERGGESSEVGYSSITFTGVQVYI